MAKQENPTRKGSRSKSEKQSEADTSNGGGAPQNGAESYEKELAAYLQERIRPGLNRGSIPMLARSIAKEIAKRDHPNGTPKESPEDDETTAAGADEEVAAEGEDETSAESGDEEVAESEDEDVAESEDEDVAESDDEDEDEAGAEAEEDDDEDEASAEAEDDAEPEDEDEEAPTAFEEDMYELQEEFGDDWIVRFSVQNDAGWLTAEKDDGSQRLEAPTADVLRKAVKLLNEDGGRPT